MLRKIQTNGRLRAAFTLVELLVVIAIIGVLVALLLPAVQAARESARRSSCLNNIRQIGLALHNYHNSFKEFPYGGDVDNFGNQQRPGFYVELLPYFEEANIADKIDPQKPIFDVSNENVGALALDLLTCPSDEPKRDIWSPEGSYWTTNYVASSGPGRLGAQDPRGVVAGCGWFATDGFMVPEKTRSFRHITDGTSQSIAFGERLYELRSWMKATQGSNSSAATPCTTNMKSLVYPITGDHSTIGYYSADPNRPSGAPLVPFNHLAFGSNHPGGANFVFADASARFLTDDTKLVILRNLGSINGEETADNEVEPSLNDVPPDRN